MTKDGSISRFAILAKACQYRICRYFLLKQFKASFFETFQFDPQGTLNILAARLFASGNPAWSMQLLELLASVPKEHLDANRVIAMRFRTSPEDKDPVIHYVLKAQSALMSCFAIRSLEIKNSLVEYSDMISLSSTEQRDMAMSDLLGGRERILREWFTEHKLSAKMVNKDKGNFYNIARQDAKAGKSMSQYVLGLIYSDGFGDVEKDSEKAIYWLKASAAQRFAHAQCTLGYMYCLGCEVEQDVKEGKMWLEAAACNGSELAKWAQLQSKTMTTVAGEK
ncbi:MAG: tetratricopeptide repeat protein [Verrucomicrobiota bacterium]